MQMPSDFDLAEYQTRIETYIQDVEQFMGLASGTLADVRHDSDYLKVLKMHATIEPLLNQLIEKSITTALAYPKVNFPAGQAVAELIIDSRLEKKIKLAEDAELIGQNQAGFIRTLAKVRNFYAHSIKNMALSVFEIARQVSPQDEGRSVTRSLFGMSKEAQRGPNGDLLTAMMHPFMFNNFAQLVYSVVQGISPPPLPLGQGILSQFMNALADQAQTDESEQ
jgi:hypothetical protein